MLFVSKQKKKKILAFKIFWIYKKYTKIKYITSYLIINLNNTQIGEKLRNFKKFQKSLENTKNPCFYASHSALSIPGLYLSQKYSKYTGWGKNRISFRVKVFFFPQWVIYVVPSPRKISYLPPNFEILYNCTSSSERLILEK